MMNHDSNNNSSHHHKNYSSVEATTLPPAVAASQLAKKHHHKMNQPNLNQTTTNNIIDIDTAMELLGMGAFQRRILWAAGLCFAADSMEVLLLSFLAVVLQVEWNLTEEQTATMVSSVFWGAVLGTLVLGAAGDSVGRKPVFLVTAALITAAGLGTAATNTYPALVLMRFVVGFGVGGLTVPFDIYAEFVTTAARGKQLLAIEYFWTAGTLLVPVMALVSLGGRRASSSSQVQEEEEQGSWRLFVVLCAIPCLISTLLGILLVPESPRWLLTQGRHAQALAILRQAATVNGKDADRLFPLETTQLVDETSDAVHRTAGQHHAGYCLGVADLWTPAWRYITSLLWISWAGLAFTYYGTIMAVTEVFADIHDNDPANDDATDAYSFDYGAIFASASAEIAGTTLAIWVVDPWGRIRTQVVTYVGGGLSVALLGWLAVQEQEHRGALIVTAFLARLCFMSASCTTWVSTAEILTTDVRTTGHSFANAVGRLGGSFSPFVVSNRSLSLQAAGLILGVASLVTAFTASRLPETAGQHMGSSVIEVTTTTTGGGGRHESSENNNKSHQHGGAAAAANGNNSNSTTTTPSPPPPPTSVAMGYGII